MRVTFYCGIIWIADSMEIMVLNILGPVLMCQWRINSLEEALITTVVFGGYLIGSPVCGYIGDTYGRRSALIMSAAWALYYGLLSALSPRYAWLLILRGLLGVGVSGVTQAVTYVSEFLPNKDRGKCIITLEIFWACGTLLEVALAMWILQSYGWRWWLAASAVPLMLFLAITAFYPESPRYQLARGDVDKAEATLIKIAKENRTTLPRGRLRGESHVERGKFTDLLSPDFLRTTILLWIVWFITAFSYYGIVLVSTEIINSEMPCLSEKKYHSPYPPFQYRHHSSYPPFQHRHHSPYPPFQHIHHSPYPPFQHRHHSPGPPFQHRHHSPYPPFQHRHHSPYPPFLHRHHSPYPPFLHRHHSPVPPFLHRHHSPGPPFLHRHHSPGPPFQHRHHSPGPPFQHRHHSPGPPFQHRHHSPGPPFLHRHHSPGPPFQHRHHSPGPPFQHRHHSPGPPFQHRHHSPGPTFQHRHHSPGPPFQHRHHSPGPPFQHRHHSPDPPFQHKHHSPGPPFQHKHHSPGPPFQHKHHSPGPPFLHRHHSPDPPFQHRHHSPGPPFLHRHHSPDPPFQHKHHSSLDLPALQACLPPNADLVSHTRHRHPQQFTCLRRPRRTVDDDDDDDDD
ncbi:hypothetical protein LSAT2_015819 [Lamellibrachia satsuma]|nr:hypothetical protein LSAT2_015819 [Lamellibrachia satsuma]